MKILIVDDNLEFLNAFTLAAEKLYGFKLYVATNKTEAFEICKYMDFEFFIIDYCLKDTDGLSLAFKLKKLFPEAKLAIFSVLNEPEGLVEKPYELWISKSSDISALIDFLSSKQQLTSIERR